MTSCPSLPYETFMNWSYFLNCYWNVFYFRKLIWTSFLDTSNEDTGMGDNQNPENNEEASGEICITDYDITVLLFKD